MLSRSLALLTLLMLAACSAPDEHALRFGLQSAPVTLDPRFAADATSERINRLLYRRLVDFDAHFRPVPALGTWRKISPLHYRVSLGESGRTFHDGKRLTAHDVSATYRSVLDPNTGSPHRAALSAVADVRAVDDDTVDFFLADPQPLFPSALTLGILPERLLASGHAFQRAPVGSGPFKFVAWPDEGKLRLQRVTDDQAFEFSKVPDPTVRVLKIMRGELDMIQNDLPPELVRYAMARGDLQVRRAHGINFSYLGLNLQDPAVGKLAVRQAIAHAIDRDAIIRFVFGGAARAAQGFFPPEHWAADPGLPAYVHDPARARALLSALGYTPEQPLRIVYKTSTDPLRVRLATIVQQQLAQVGIAADLRSYDWGTFFADVQAGRFQMYGLAWVGTKTPDVFKYALHSSSMPPHGANRGRFRDAEFDHLVEAADAAPTASAYRAVAQRMHALLPYVPLWYEDHVFIARRNIQGYAVAPDGNYDGLVNVRRKSGSPQQTSNRAAFYRNQSRERLDGCARAHVMQRSNRAAVFQRFLSAFSN